MINASRQEIANLIEAINKDSVFTQNTKDNVTEMFDVRVCSTCGNIMWQGYCIEGGVSYYCSDECMESDGMSLEEFNELFDDGNGDTYWTDWI